MHNSYLKRIEALKNKTASNHFELIAQDGSRHRMKRGQLLPVFQEALSGVESADSQIILNAVADNSGTRLRELMQAVLGPIRRRDD